MRIAIMQPAWLPWVGYFDLIGQVDLFVYLDTVQFRRRSWQCRNIVKTNKGPRWISMPIAQTERNETSIDGAIVQPTHHIRKWVQTLQQAYGKAQSFKREFPVIKTWLREIECGQSLANLNISFIETMKDRMEISTETIRASSLPAFAGRVERLVSICEHLGAKTYVSPPGSADYIFGEHERFAAKDIELVFHRYDHPCYRQCHGKFVSHLSVVDLLLNHGEWANAIIASGNRLTIPSDKFYEARISSGGEDKDELQAT